MQQVFGDNRTGVDATEWRRYWNALTNYCEKMARTWVRLVIISNLCSSESGYSHYTLIFYFFLYFSHIFEVVFNTYLSG